MRVIVNVYLLNALAAGPQCGLVVSLLGDLEAGPHGELNAGNMRIKCGWIVNIYG